MSLFAPGSIPVPEDVRIAMVGETLRHRTLEFEAVFTKARELLLRLFGMFEVVTLASTGAMEAPLLNICCSKNKGRA